jgi:hypothetical protein
VKRLFRTEVFAGQGGVYREVGTTNDCIDSFVVDTLEPPTCEIYPSTAEHIGSLPDTFGSSDELDPVPWVFAWNDIYLGNFAFSRTYPNLWRRLTENPNPGAPPPAPAATPDLIAHRVFLLDEYATDCYCVGEGIDFLRLRIGTPQFPNVETLPFFWIPFPEGFEPPILSVRESNPDGPPLTDTCCDNGEVPGIMAEIVDGELQLQRREKPEQEFKFNKYDQHEAFQMVSGYPRWCCVEDPCVPGKYVMRFLHFPTWPRLDTHDPLECGGGDEPLGYIPFVTDVVCTDAGELAVYYGGLAVHDGKISDVKWDTPPPRPGPNNPPNDQAPDNPEDLEINKDYQDNDVLTDGFAAPIAADAAGNTCDAAQALLGKVPCPLVCPDDADICPVGGMSTETTVNGPDAQTAINDAYDQAITDIGINCAAPVPIYICGIVQLDDGTYDATVKWCC